MLIAVLNPIHLKGIQKGLGGFHVTEGSFNPNGVLLIHMDEFREQDLPAENGIKPFSQSGFLLGLEAVEVQKSVMFIFFVFVAPIVGEIHHTPRILIDETVVIRVLNPTDRFSRIAPRLQSITHFGLEQGLTSNFYPIHPLTQMLRMCIQVHWRYPGNQSGNERGLGYFHREEQR